MKNNKRVHFFKADSRLGMINLPYGEEQLNLGVEDGPDAVLSEKFVSTFQSCPGITKYKFPFPEDIDRLDYEPALYRSLKEFGEVINQNLKTNEIQVVVGGDHAVAMSSLIAVLGRMPAASVGYIQFDSHGDLHTFATSPSGNFHGMWLRPFLGQFDKPMIDSLVPQKLQPNQILYIGNLTLESEEVTFMHRNQITNLTREQLVAEPWKSRLFLEKFLKRFPHIHVSFDIDVFDKSVVKATGTPSKAGLFLEDVDPLLELLAQHQDISIDLVEVNPKKAGADGTIKVAREVLTKLLPNW
ncbi:hypothetical protein CO018_01610 [Candidatus Beckwithbacteria bacterium CG_4_9_14_0_2_um_filter_47_11]|uniref:Arginase n=1 Tax=Candidatus Beckwithbacteria bacterium CG_4_9_14_0_2_um_filter_47_11 TaxID=1974494 RepID=A0A2M8G4G4_9BACT|nr:MAG: hypothetical protein CO018_01610 [Candidatus Beckwithbacteria bacterium CG_4_9_14_0_2_um_filter_47_11]